MVRRERESRGTVPTFCIICIYLSSTHICIFMSAADVKMEIPVLVRSLKSSIMSSTSFQMGDPLLESGE